MRCHCLVDISPWHQCCVIVQIVANWIILVWWKCFLFINHPSISLSDKIQNLTYLLHATLPQHPQIWTTMASIWHWQKWLGLRQNALSYWAANAIWHCGCSFSLQACKKAPSGQKLKMNLTEGAKQNLPSLPKHQFQTKTSIVQKRLYCFYRRSAWTLFDETCGKQKLSRGSWDWWDCVLSGNMIEDKDLFGMEAWMSMMMMTCPQ